MNNNMDRNNIITFSPERYYYENRYGIFKWDDKFIVNDGLLPIMKLLNDLNPSIIDPLLVGKRVYGGRCFKWSIDPYGRGEKMSRTLYRRRRDRIAIYPTFNLYSGFYSAIGYRDIIYENSRVEINSTCEKTAIAENYDILILAVIKKPYRYENEECGHNYQSLKIKEKDIILLVNSEKLDKNGKFMTEYYTVTVRKYLKEFLKKVEYRNISEIRVVSDEYLNNFINQGADLNTNSIIEIMEIQKKVVDRVFSTLTPESITI